MSLIFSSGGGRLGNQLLNLIHLYAISYEYEFEVYKIKGLLIDDDDFFTEEQKEENIETT